MVYFLEFLFIICNAYINSYCNDTVWECERIESNIPIDAVGISTLNVVKVKSSSSAFLYFWNNWCTGCREIYGVCLTFINNIVCILWNWYCWGTKKNFPINSIILFCILFSYVVVFGWGYNAGFVQGYNFKSEEAELYSFFFIPTFLSIDLMRKYMLMLKDTLLLYNYFLFELFFTYHKDIGILSLLFGILPLLAILCVMYFMFKFLFKKIWVICKKWVFFYFF